MQNIFRCNHLCFPYCVKKTLEKTRILKEKTSFMRFAKPYEKRKDYM